MKVPSEMKIGVIGGGVMGLALAHRLSKEGARVVVVERDGQVGGLATYHDFGPFFWDRFYHVILPSDTHLIRFIGEIGLADQIRWERTLTGFYENGAFYSMSSSLEFLKFPLLSLWGKVRLALTILYCARISDWKRLEKIPVEDWLIKVSGRATYEKIWKPLLLAKLGESYRRVSAVFIWSYVKRMFSARDSSAKKEQLGHVSGGYKTVLNRLEERIGSAGGEVRMGVRVRKISPCHEGGLWVEYDRGRDRFDKVIFTGPTSALENVADSGLVSLEKNGKVEYLGVICMVLITKRPLVPYYVVNIADARVPFTGVIGMSNVVSTKETAGFHLTYLPKYVLSDDPLLLQSDDEIRSLFFKGIRVMFPSLPKEEIVGVHIHRAVKVQPLQVIDYSSVTPRVTTNHPDFFVLNTAQFVQSTLNNNEVIRAVDDFLETYGPRLGRRHDQANVSSQEAVYGNA